MHYTVWDYQDPYVRKTAAVCVAKLYDISPGTFITWAIFAQILLAKLVYLKADSFHISVNYEMYCMTYVCPLHIPLYAELVEDRGFLEVLHDLISDANPTVVSRSHH
jgi:hypothetical protein